MYFLLIGFTLYVCSLGEDYLNKSFGSLGHPLGTAKDLTFVSVLDKNGQPLRHASSVEVWNTKKNNVRSYPIVKGMCVIFYFEFILNFKKCLRHVCFTKVSRARGMRIFTFFEDISKKRILEIAFYCNYFFSRLAKYYSCELKICLKMWIV